MRLKRANTAVYLWLGQHFQLLTSLWILRVNSHNIIVLTYLFDFLYVILHLYVQVLFILIVLDAVKSTSSVPSASYTSTEALYRSKLN